MASSPALPTRISQVFQVSGLTPELITDFRAEIYRHYEEQGRDLPWRRTDDPYEILISEFMLQQTQVERVLSKYPLFLERFPVLGSWRRRP